MASQRNGSTGAQTAGSSPLSKPLFGSIAADARARLPFLQSDFTDAFQSGVLSARCVRVSGLSTAPMRTLTMPNHPRRLAAGGTYAVHHHHYYHEDARRALPLTIIAFTPLQQAKIGVSHLSSNIFDTQMGLQMEKETDGQFTSVHIFASSAVCGLLQALFGAQPLMIIASSEPFILLWKFVCSNFNPFCMLFETVAIPRSYRSFNRCSSTTT